MNQSAPITCRDSPINAFWNNPFATPDQVLLNAPLLPPMLAYSIVGGVASVFNIICFLVFVTKKDLRHKYLLFEFLAFANLINTVFMCQAGILRRHLIYTNQMMQLRSSFECLQYVGPHLQLLGGQLPAIVLLVIDIERLLAVYKPIFFKVYITERAQVYMVIGCCVIVIISQLFGYLSSYLSQASCSTAFCNVSNAYGISYSNFNSAIVVLVPIFALILNIFTYFRAKKIGTHANRKREIDLVLVTMMITLVNVILIACPNILLFVFYNGLVAGNAAVLAYTYVLFCSNSAINLFVYIWLKRDFRNHLLNLMFISQKTLIPAIPKVSKNRIMTIRGSATLVVAPINESKL